MAQSFYPTALTVIDAALRICRTNDAEGTYTPSTTQRNNALEAFNFLVTSWQAHGMQVWCQKQATWALVAATNSATVGPGGVINIARPMSIQQAWIRNTTSTPSTDIPLRIIGRDEYNLLSSKNSVGPPNCLFYDPQYDLPATNSGANAKGTIYIWPTPDATTVTTYDLYFIYTRPLQDFSVTSDSLDFPQEWGNALKWNLAAEIMPEYGLPFSDQDRIHAKAESTLELAKSWDRETASVSFQPDTIGLR
jgi:hypothetical protein